MYISQAIKMQFLYSCATVYKMQSDLARRAVSMR